MCCRCRIATGAARWWTAGENKPCFTLLRYRQTSLAVASLLSPANKRP